MQQGPTDTGRTAGSASRATYAGVLTLDADGRWQVDDSGTPEGVLTEDADGRAQAEALPATADYRVRRAGSTRHMAY